MSLEYAFVHKEQGDKKGLFESLGYDIINSQQLLNEYCSQTKEKYSNGDFVLHELKEYGQIINIAITLPNKKGCGNVSIKSGWLVYPDGEIRLATVFAGWIK